MSYTIAIGRTFLSRSYVIDPEDPFLDYYSRGRKAAYTSVLNNVAALSTKTSLECLTPANLIPLVSNFSSSSTAMIPKISDKVKLRDTFMAPVFSRT